jgi:hypothetical protein
MQAVSVRGTLTQSELAEATRYMIWHRSPALKMMCAIACLIGLAGLASLFLGMGMAGVPPVILSALYLYFLYRMPQMTVQKQWKTFAHFGEEATYEFDDEHFKIAWPSLQVSRPWSSVESTVELPDQFLIFVAKTTVHPVPKRFFTSEQLEAVRLKLRALVSS